MDILPHVFELALQSRIRRHLDLSAINIITPLTRGLKARGCRRRPGGWHYRTLTTNTCTQLSCETLGVSPVPSKRGVCWSVACLRERRSQRQFMDDWASKHRLPILLLALCFPLIFLPLYFCAALSLLSLLSTLNQPDASQHGWHQRVRESLGARHQCERLHLTSDSAASQRNEEQCTNGR